MKNRKNKDIIVPSCSGLVTPVTLILGSYIILHGHLSPGGGFQGGVLIAGILVIYYLAYGREKTLQTFHMKAFSVSEDMGALFFLLLASLGIIYGTSFFANVIGKGSTGDLFSSGTIFLMNFAVGYKVLAGIGILIIVMLRALRDDDKEDVDNDN